MNLDLSVVVACYNCANTLERCLDSIPKNVGIEIILVDDNSKDQTISIIKHYIDCHKREKIILISNEMTMGAGRTRNRGIEKATKKYITFLDSDDEFSENFLTSISPILDKDQDCIVFDAALINQNNSLPLKMFYTNDLHEGILRQNDTLVYVRGATWGKIYKREIITAKKVLFGNIKRNEDLIFTKTAIAYCMHIYYVEEPLYRYNENQESLMHNKSLLTEKNAIVAVSSIKETLISEGFTEEFNSIYFLEVVYSTTLTLIALGKTNKECRNHYKTISKEYNRKDKYRHRYNRKYKIAYILFALGLFDVIRSLLRK